MRFIKGLRILLTKSWYNFSFILSLIATGIISVWILNPGLWPPSLTDPLQGVLISIVVSFQYYVITLIIMSLVPKGRTIFFEDKNQLRNQLLLCIVFVALFMALGFLSALVGPYVGAALTFGDASITAYFTVLLGWNVGNYISAKVANRPKMNWTVFLVFLVIGIMAFGGAFMFLGLATLPFSQQIVLLVFPLLLVMLPILTIFLRDREAGPDQTTIMAVILFAFGLYYTFRLVNILDPQWTQLDILIQVALLIYGLSTTVAKVEESVGPNPTISLSLVLFVILSRVGSQVNRLLANAAGFGDIVHLGVTSFAILLLSVLGLLVPVYWMRRRKALSD